MPDIFCQIIKRKAKAFIVYESKSIIAFLDNEPVSKGHILMIPKKHSTELQNTDPKILKDVIILTAKLSKILKNLFKYDGIIFTCTSSEKLQDVKHLHFHIYGKNKNQKILYYQTLKDPKEREKTLQQTANLIKKEINILSK